MRYLLLFLGVYYFLLFCGCAPKPEFPSGEIIDLTHPFDDQTIFWPTEERFVFEKGFEGFTDDGYYYTANKFCTAEHGGTHIDAPIHFFKDGKTVDAIPLDQLIGSAVVVDVTAKCLANRDYQIQLSDFLDWENQYGRLPSNTIVLIRTGFGTFWPDREKYMGTSERGPEAVMELHFPGLHPDAATWLVGERSVKAIGIDTPSIDYGQSNLFQTHVTLFEANIPAFENVASLNRLPVRGFTIVALPMKIKGGSGGPLRIVAIVP